MNAEKHMMRLDALKELSDKINRAYSQSAHLKAITQLNETAVIHAGGRPQDVKGLPDVDIVAELLNRLAIELNTSMEEVVEQLHTYNMAQRDCQEK